MNCHNEKITNNPPLTTHWWHMTTPNLTPTNLLKMPYTPSTSSYATRITNHVVAHVDPKHTPKTHYYPPTIYSPPPPNPFHLPQLLTLPQPNHDQTNSHTPLTTTPPPSAIVAPPLSQLQIEPILVVSHNIFIDTYGARHINYTTKWLGYLHSEHTNEPDENLFGPPSQCDRTIISQVVNNYSNWHPNNNVTPYIIVLIQ